jgi:hypothetical protein
LGGFQQVLLYFYCIAYAKRSPSIEALAEDHRYPTLWLENAGERKRTQEIAEETELIPSAFCVQE